LQKLPKFPNFGPRQLETKADFLRTHQTEITVLSQFHVSSLTAEVRVPTKNASTAQDNLTFQGE
jgi:hypothetical protein